MECSKLIKTIFSLLPQKHTQFFLIPNYICLIFRFKVLFLYPHALPTENHPSFIPELQTSVGRQASLDWLVGNHLWSGKIGGIKVTADVKEKMIPKITVGHTSLQLPHYLCLGTLRLFSTSLWIVKIRREQYNVTRVMRDSRMQS